MLGLLGCGASRDQRIEVRIAVGGQAQLVYLPTTLAQSLGHYEQEGLQVTLQDFPGGAKALEALLGGSTDVVSGFYDHTIQMAAEGRSLQAFVSMLRYLGLAAVVSPASPRKIRRIEDLRGATVGVSAPGSSTHLFARYLLATRGVPPDSISAVGIGMSASAVAAMERGKVDAAIMADPAIAYLTKRRGALTILADTRTAEGVRAVFGTGSYPASVLYSSAEWIQSNRETARRLARAIQRTLRWIQAHSPEEVARAMPPEFHGEDESLYVESLRRAMVMYSCDGRMPADGPEAVRKVLAVSLPKVREARIDLAKTYTNDLLEAPARTPVRLAIGAQASMSHLAVYLAHYLGLFQEEGLEVTLDEFPGGSKGLEALLGGSVDVVSGFYDQTIQMAAEGKELTAFATMMRSLMIAVVASPAARRPVRRVEDLRGATVGVTTLGAPTHHFLNHLLRRSGMSASDVSPVAMGTTARAVAAMERGVVDAGVVSDFTIRHLEKRFGKLTILADTRTAAGVREVYGADVYPGAALIATSDWLRRNPGTARRLARAVRQAMDWIRTHTAEEVAAKMPAPLRGDDPEIYTSVIRETVPMLNSDGAMPPGAPEAVRRSMAVWSENVRAAKIDLSKTYSNEFVRED